MALTEQERFERKALLAIVRVWEAHGKRMMKILSFKTDAVFPELLDEIEAQVAALRQEVKTQEEDLLKAFKERNYPVPPPSPTPHPVPTCPTCGSDNPKHCIGYCPDHWHDGYEPLEMGVILHAGECPQCGGTLDSEGRCPNCNPAEEKPNNGVHDPEL